MSLAQLKQEAVELSPAGQNELMMFLASIQIAADDELRSELTHKSDDTDSESWVSLDDLVHHNQSLPPLCQI